MYKLKTCPFCDCEAHISYNTAFGFIPWCTNENCMLNDNEHGYDTEEEAAEAWNERAIHKEDYPSYNRGWNDCLSKMKNLLETEF